MRWYCRLFLLSIIFETIACRNDPSPAEAATFEKDILAKNISARTFTQDEFTNAASGAVQLYDDSTHSVLCIFSPFSQRLSVYDYKSGEQIKSLNLAARLNRKLSYCKVHNLDSILCYSYATGYTYITDSALNFSDSFQLKHPIDTVCHLYYPSPFPKTGNSMFLWNDVLYTVGWIGGEPIKETERKILTAFDLKRRTLSWYVPYPAEYSRKNWGGSFFRMGYFTDAGDKFLISFPASENLQILDKTTLTLAPAKVAKSKYHTEIKPLELPLGLCMDAKVTGLHYSTQFSYSDIVFDPYRKLFYRFAELPVEKKDCNE
jgi:hypothetical protein